MAGQEKGGISGFMAKTRLQKATQGFGQENKGGKPGLQC